jgi:hypothetical protein
VIRLSRIEPKPDVPRVENERRNATRANHIATTAFEVDFTAEGIHKEQILKGKRLLVDTRLFLSRVESNKHGIQILDLGRCCSFDEMVMLT